ncbi:MAG: DUF1573 domain-containing protein [Lentimicrobium sp.]
MKTMLWISAFLLTLNFQESVAQTSVKKNAAATDIKAMTATGPVAKYDKTVYEFGELQQGVPQTATFTLSNEGTEPLIISSARASCGCTNLKYEKDPILPGKSTTISVTYNAAAAGNFIKTITVNTNADEKPVILSIKGLVNPKMEDPKS